MALSGLISWRHLGLFRFACVRNAIKDPHAIKVQWKKRSREGKSCDECRTRTTGKKLNTHSSVPHAKKSRGKLVCFPGYCSRVIIMVSFSSSRLRNSCLATPEAKIPDSWKTSRKQQCSGNTLGGNKFKFNCLFGIFLWEIISFLKFVFSRMVIKQDLESASFADRQRRMARKWAAVGPTPVPTFAGNLL